MAPLLRRRRIAVCLKASALAVVGGSAASSSCGVVSAFGTSPVPQCGSISLPASACASSSSLSPRHSSPPSRSCSSSTRSSRGAAHVIHHPSQRRTTGLLASTEEDLASPSTPPLLSQASLVEDDNNNSNTDADADSIPLAAFGGWQERLFLGIEPTPEILAIMTIYFVEGALGLARLAQTFLLKDTLHLGPAEMAALTGLFTLPW